jgi:hypothetical protein
MEPNLGGSPESTSGEQKVSNRNYRNYTTES